jgi:hypothetical protein
MPNLKARSVEAGHARRRSLGAILENWRNGASGLERRFFTKHSRHGLAIAFPNDIRND